MHPSSPASSRTPPARVVTHAHVRVKVRFIERGRLVVYGMSAMAAFRVFLITLALTAPVWALQAMTVSACTCGLDLPRIIARAELVVLATVLDQDIVEGPVIKSGQYRVESTIVIDTYLKGKGPERLSVWSTASVREDADGAFEIIHGLGAGCEWAPTPGVRYLMFVARDEEGAYQAGGCSSYADGEFVDELVDDIRQLLQEPTPQPTIVDLPETGTGVSVADSSLSWQITAAAGLLLAASASAIFVAVRRRPI